MPDQKPLIIGQPAAEVLSSAQQHTADTAGEQKPRTRDFPFDKGDILVTLAVSACVGAAYAPFVCGWLAITGDFGTHMKFGRLIVENGVISAPACLLHILTAALVWSGVIASYEFAGQVVVVSAHALTGAAIFLCARWVFRAQGPITGRALSAVMGLAVPFVQPLVPPQMTYSIGYIWAEPYHSPTYSLLKPFALGAAVFAVYFLAELPRPHWKTIAFCAATVAAGTLAKPNYAISAMPALAICSAYLFARKQPFSKSGVLYGWLIPALAVLAWQYTRTYTAWKGPPRYADSIIFAPLAVMRFHTDNIAAPYFWSILLPLSVLVLYGRRAWTDTGLRFSWLAFLFGTTYTYTLAEKQHLAAGNFLWSAYITLFVLYFFSIVFVLNQIMSAPRTLATFVRAVPCIAILAWHLMSGINVHRIYLRMVQQVQVSQIHDAVPRRAPEAFPGPDGSQSRPRPDRYPCG